MKTLSSKFLALGALLLLGCALTGCSGKTDTPSANADAGTSTPAAKPGGAAATSSKSGSTADMGVSGAPSGAQTGTDGGKK